MAEDPALLAALTRGRRAVEESMAFWAQQNGRWDEEPMTVILCQNAAPHVKPITFNKRQEGVIGADWLWWWVDPSGTCFGMLIQAKNLERRKDSWSIDFEHANKSGPQLDLLLRAADLFQVAPAYVLYCGDINYRTGLSCGFRHTEPICDRCTRAGVSVLSALAVQYFLLLSKESAAVDAYAHAVPLEDLANPTVRQRPLWDDPNFSNVPELRSFLVERQHGAFQVAKLLFTQVSKLRRAQMLMAAPRRFDVGGGNIFPHLPVDSGHFSRSYYGNILRGLRTELPSYVRDAEAGRALPLELAGRIAGIAIFYL
ncbi:hypothetical protein [Streptomyces scabiei]|uniref:hypothetical protein n=1 Tax=Streptomyces scabiei TaxID=1930 RepID=UPI0038F672FB